jgi:hypothetical protein
MKIHEIDFTKEARYKDSNGNKWKVRPDKKMLTRRESGIDTYTSVVDCYNIVRLLEIDFTPDINWDNVPIDTKCRVRMNGAINWSRRYFAGVKMGVPSFYRFGANSWSVASNSDATVWDEYEIVED